MASTIVLRLRRQWRLTSIGSIWYWLTPAFLMGIVAVDRVLDTNASLLMGGTLDEIGHWLTGAILALSVKALRFQLALWPVLLGAFIIDLDHVLTWEGIIDPVTNTSRTGVHSLAVVWLVLLLAAVLPQSGVLELRSIGFGMATHLFRDMATGTVPLLWPIRDTLVSYSHNTYIWVLAAATGLSVAHAASHHVALRRKDEIN